MTFQDFLFKNDKIIDAQGIIITGIKLQQKIIKVDADVLKLDVFIANNGRIWFELDSGIKSASGYWVLKILLDTKREGPNNQRREENA